MIKDKNVFQFRVDEPKVIKIGFLQEEKRRRLECGCVLPSVTYSVKHRTIFCEKCQAYLDPFDFIERFAKNFNEIQKAQEKACENLKRLEREVREKRDKKNKKKEFFFMDAEEKFMGNGKHPICPKCGEGFSFFAIKKWLSRDEYESQEKRRKNSTQ